MSPAWTDVDVLPQLSEAVELQTQSTAVFVPLAKKPGAAASHKANTTPPPATQWTRHWRRRLR